MKSFIIVIIGLTLATLLLGLAGCTRKEEVSAEAGAIARYRYDPSRAPGAMKENCRREGKELLAWRADGNEWEYACVRGEYGTQQGG